MKRFRKLTVANLKMTVRDREALFWMFLFPIVLMLVLGFIFGRSGEANLNVGVVDLDRSTVSKAVVGALRDVEPFTLTEGGTRKQQLERLSDAKLNAVLVLENGFSGDVLSGNPGSVTLYVDRSSVSVAQMASISIRQVIGEIARGMSGSPDLIALSEKSVLSDGLKYVDFLVPGVIAITLMAAGLLGLNLEVANYREKGILRRIKVSPLPLSRFLGSKITSVLILALCQTAVLLLVGRLVFKVHIKGNMLYVAVLIIIGAVSFLALGFLITSLARTLKTAQMAGSALNIPMMMLSGVFFPLQIMPPALVVIAKMLPLYYLGDALREVMIRGRGLGAVWLDILVLAGMGMACFLVSIRLFRWE